MKMSKANSAKPPKARLEQEAEVAVANAIDSFTVAGDDPCSGFRSPQWARLRLVSRSGLAATRKKPALDPRRYCFACHLRASVDAHRGGGWAVPSLWTLRFHARSSGDKSTRRFVPPGAAISPKATTWAGLGCGFNIMICRDVAKGRARSSGDLHGHRQTL